MMKKILLRTFISSVLSGFCIVFGASVFLLCKGNGGTYGMQILGSLLFAIGLFTIIHFKLWLYTGRVGGLLDKNPKYIIRLIVCLLGNLLGTFVLALLIRIAGGSQADMLVEQSKAIVALKLEETAMQAMIRSILCGMMIYVAVKGHAICEYSLGKVLFAFLPICLFILCGYEHVVANGAYFTFAGVFNAKAVLLFVIWGIGNGVGAIMLDGSLKLIVRLDDRKWIPVEKDSIGLDRNEEVK